MNIGKIVVGLAVVGTTIWGFLAPPIPTFKEPELARILFWHLPFAFVSVVFVVWAIWQSVSVLRTGGNIDRDIRAEAASEITMLFACITMASGMLFSHVQWGAFWSWDPRQTSFLFVLLILFAYFAIRAAITDQVKKAVSSAAYAVAASLPILFLIFVYPRLEQVKRASLHPSNTIVDGGLGDYWFVVLANFVLFTFIAHWLYTMRVKVSHVEWDRENRDARMDDGGHGAATGVVRPLSVSDEN